MLNIMTSDATSQQSSAFGSRYPATESSCGKPSINPSTSMSRNFGSTNLLSLPESAHKGVWSNETGEVTYKQDPISVFNRRNVSGV